jgi:hypothetical protein
MAARIQRQLKIIEVNANGILRHHYELSKELQDLHIDVLLALLSKTHLKSHDTSNVPNHHFYHTDRFPGRKGETVIAVSKGIPHNHAVLPPLVSIEATWVCIPIGNIEVPLAAVYKDPGHTDITELLSFIHVINGRRSEC